MAELTQEEINQNCGIDLHEPVPHTFCEVMRETLSLVDEKKDEELYAQEEEEEETESTTTTTTKAPTTTTTTTKKA